jgi:hypothetical protein
MEPLAASINTGSRTKTTQRKDTLRGNVLNKTHTNLNANLFGTRSTVVVGTTTEPLAALHNHRL